MRIYINDIEYRLTNNAEIVEQAGATAVMSATILIEEQRIPEPFDRVEIEDGGGSAGFDSFENGVRDNTVVLDGVLSLKKDIDGTWNQWDSLAWEDIA
jgi:hypothetical protein